LVCSTARLSHYYVREEAWPKQHRRYYASAVATIAPRNAPHILAFVERMAVLGFREGNNFALEHVPVAGIEGYDGAFRELASRDVNIFVALQ
jgi:hypothetical protein